MLTSYDLAAIQRLPFLVDPAAIQRLPCIFDGVLTWEGDGLPNS